MTEFLPGFTLDRKTHIHELTCDVLELTHKKTGAQILHIANEDEENLFSLSFRTYPKTSNGVAHILEHTVLCGSKKYPVKDPFFAMNRRSLNTFMNALTGQDFTCYPAATQVEKDFYNLLEVYSDAVFHPHLKKESFLQEGWRLNAPSHEVLEYHGIVYNEMKGALSTPLSRLYEAINESIFPDLTYGINSGGDPKVIPELTHEGLVDFHKTYYHPSRCLFFFYGNLPLEKHLRFLEEKVLSQCEKKEQLKPLPKQLKFNAPVSKRVPYPTSPEEGGKEMIALSFLTCTILEQEELLALEILESILMDTDTSPLKKALMKSGLCQEANAFLEVEMSEAPFVLILRGCKENSEEEVAQFVEKALKEIVEKGIKKEQVENALHQLEFHRSEITGGGTPFGLTLFMRAALLKQHGGAPCDALHIHSLFDQLRGRLKKEPRYLESLIQRYLIDNPHRSVVAAYPSKTLVEEEKRGEVERLKEIRRTLSDKDLEQITQEQTHLKAFQEKQEHADLEVLPKLTLADVPKKGKQFSLSQEKIENLTVFHHDTFTNDIVYANLSILMPHIEREKLPYVRLLAALLTELPCAGMSLDETLTKMHATTGGIGAALTTNIQVEDATKIFPRFHLTGKALGRNLEPFFGLIRGFLTSPDLSDLGRLKELIQKHFTILESSFSQKALKYALSLSTSTLSHSGVVSEAWFGLEYFFFVKNLGQEISTIQKELQKMCELLLNPRDADFVLTCSKEKYDEIKKTISTG